MFELGLDRNGDYAAVIAQIDAVSGETVRTWEWNPTSALDAVHGLASGGQRLYAAMSVNAVPGTRLDGARAVVGWVARCTKDGVCPP